MAKKSKSKKRKHAQKRSSGKSSVAKQSSKAKAHTKANKNSEIIAEFVEPDSVVDDLTEKEQASELLSETNPREQITQKWMVVALIAVIVFLVGLLLYFYSQTQQATLDSQKAAQEQLLKVNEASGDSLGPTSGQNSSNPQPSTSPTEGTGGSASDLQPQQPTTPEQLNQLQQ